MGNSDGSAGERDAFAVLIAALRLAKTEAWGADAPAHMIQFNGERFLGLYPPGD